jgi:uncharacterized protein YqeY
VIKQQIEADLKKAMLAGDKSLVSVLRGLKSSILDAEISQGSREAGLNDAAVVTLLQKEAKKRGDAVELYANAGETERSENERYEQEVIKRYLPEMLGDAEIEVIVSAVIEEMGGNVQKQQMGKVIAAVKEKTEGRAEGAVIARVVQKQLS